MKRVQVSTDVEPVLQKTASSRASAKQQDRSDNIRLIMVGCIFQQKQQRSSRSKQELTSMSMLEDGLNDRLQRQFPDYIIL